MTDVFMIVEPPQIFLSDVMEFFPILINIARHPPTMRPISTATKSTPETTSIMERVRATEERCVMSP
jgi:hypothetical protein